MSDLLKYRSAIKAIKDAILISQYESVVSINEKQLILYASVGKYISDNTRNGFWGLDAIRVISEHRKPKKSCSGYFVLPAGIRPSWNRTG